MKIYPNLTENGNFRIELMGLYNLDQTNVKIVDLPSRSVFERNYNLQVKTILSCGVYMEIEKNGQFTGTRKLVINSI